MQQRTIRWIKEIKEASRYYAKYSTLIWPRKKVQFGTFLYHENDPAHSLTKYCSLAVKHLGNAAFICSLSKETPAAYITNLETQCATTQDCLLAMQVDITGRHMYAEKESRIHKAGRYISMRVHAVSSSLNGTRPHSGGTSRHDVFSYRYRN